LSIVFGFVLKPETADSWEAGLKGQLADGRFDWELSYFHMNFDNLVIRENIGGLPGLENAGSPLRTAVADSPHRHSVAQGLQQKMFEAEVMLRRALKARFSEAPTVEVGTLRAADVHEFRRKAAG